PARTRVERVRRRSLDDVDAPATVEPIDVAHVEPPASVVTEDRAPLDRWAREVLSRRLPDRGDLFLISAGDADDPAPLRPRPSQSVDEEKLVAVCERACRPRPMTRTVARRSDEKMGARRVERSGQV